MQTILNDLKAAAGLFMDMRKARKHGSAIRIEKKAQIPFFRSGGLYNTVEGCVLSWLGENIVKRSEEVFDELPGDIKYLMYFPPKDGEFIDRVNFWRHLLEPVLTDEELRTAMVRILRWYIHIKHIDIGLKVPVYDTEEGRAW